MARIGFGIENGDEAAVAQPLQENSTFALNFDNGGGITLEDLFCHLFVAGTTGSGKSWSVMLPLVKKLLELGLAGLIVDIKGNFRAQTRVLAQTCGRDADLVEFGTSSTATPINLLQGLDRFEIFRLYETLTLASFKGESHNLDFHIKGVNAATDCTMLLRFLARRDPQFEPNLALVAEMVNNIERAQALYNLFKKKVYNPRDDGHYSLVSGIEQNEFHILRDFSGEKGHNSTREEQRTYAMQAIRIALKTFLDAPGVAENFAASGADGIDISKLLREGKVILLRFNPGAGITSAMLGRYLATMYYGAVLKAGLEKPVPDPTFICLDEYQEFADLSDRALSDTSFVAQAREFRSIFMAASQSMSALFNRGASVPAVQAMVSNCNNRVIFYSDDPLTQDMVNRHNHTLMLTDLKPGEAFVVQYDKNSRVHKHGLQTFQKAYQETCASLGENLETPSPLRTRPAPRRVSLLNLYRKAENVLGKHGPKGAAGRSSRMDSDLEELRRAHRRGSHELDFMEAAVEEEAAREDICRHWLLEEFGEYFAESGVRIECPHGWDKIVRQGFLAFRATGLNIRLSGLIMHASGLKIQVASAGDSGARGSTGAFRLLESLLARASEYCAICGDKLVRESGEWGEFSDESGAGEQYICTGCLDKFGLAPAKPGLSG